jgi:hypothetical protein
VTQSPPERTETLEPVAARPPSKPAPPAAKLARTVRPAPLRPVARRAPSRAELKNPFH